MNDDARFDRDEMRRDPARGTAVSRSVRESGAVSRCARVHSFAVGRLLIAGGGGCARRRKTVFGYDAATAAAAAAAAAAPARRLSSLCCGLRGCGRRGRRGHNCNVSENGMR